MNASIRSKTFFRILSISLLLAACGRSPSANMAQSSLKRITSPNVPSADAQTLVDGNNAFAVDIYQTLSAKDGNLILSPFSISLALAMTYAGARGETESQMADALHFDLPQGQLHPAFNALDQELATRGEANSKDEKPLQLNIANAVWAERTYPFLQDFLDVIASNYGAGIALADFINKPENVRKEINDWVYDQTQKKIKDLVPEGVINSDTRMALVNAIYFKADWSDPFDPVDGFDAPFHLLDGTDLTVRMMHQSMFTLYSRGDGFRAAELSYAGGTAAMDLFVPDEGNFQTFESSLTAGLVNETLNNLQSNELELTMPKFTFESQFDLPDALKSMGMLDAFDPDLADFSGMTAQDDLFISDVIHKAFVGVDEKGTEAAAASAAFAQISSALPGPPTLWIDRPFIFIIRDVSSGQILFIGRVLNPLR